MEMETEKEIKGERERNEKRGERGYANSTLLHLYANKYVDWSMTKIPRTRD